jgi:hypothetical protein
VDLPQVVENKLFPLAIFCPLSAIADFRQYFRKLGNAAWGSAKQRSRTHVWKPAEKSKADGVFNLSVK